MIKYHQCTVPEPLTQPSLSASDGLPASRDDFAFPDRFRNVEVSRESEHGVMSKELTNMPCALKTLYTMYTMQATTHLGPH